MATGRTIRQASLDLTINATGATSGAQTYENATKRVTGSTSSAQGTIKRLIRTLGELWVAYRGYGIVKESIQIFAQFERQMANVSTMLQQNTMRFLPGYSRQIRALSIAMGESTATLSKGLYDILSASVKAEDAMEMLVISSRAAQAGLTDTGVSADALTTILNSYGLGIEYAGKISSDLFETVQRGKITFEQLASSIGYVASMGATAGLSIEEMMGAIATMTRAGLQSDIAITSLKNIVKEFVNPSTDAKKAMKELGLEMNTATLKAIGLRGVFEKLSHKSVEFSNRIFGDMRAQVGASALLQQYQGFVEDVDYVLQSSGKDLEAYGKMVETTAKKFERFHAAMDELKRSLGEVLGPSVANIADAITKWVEEDPTRFAYWGKRVQNELDRVKDHLLSFATYLKDDFSGAADLAWELFLAGMELAGRAAVELAARTGKGMWQALKDSIFGQDDMAVMREREAIYKNWFGGEWLERREAIGGYGSSMSYRTVKEPTDTAAWAASLDIARDRVEREARNDIFEGFGDTLAKDIADARKEVKDAVDKATSRPGGASFTDRAADINARHDATIRILKAEGEANKKLQSGVETFFDYILKGAEQVQRVVKTMERWGVESGQQTFSKKSLPKEPPVADPKIKAAKERVREIQDAARKEMEIIGRLEDSHKRAAEAIEYEKNVRIAYADSLSEQRAELERYYDLMKKLERQERLVKMGREFGQAWGRGFEDFVLGTMKAKDAARSLFEDIERLMIRRLVTDRLAQVMGDWFISWGTPRPTGNKVPMGATDITTAPEGVRVAHEGWRVGDPGGPRRHNLNLSMFANAPRLHSGLRHDEYPAILQYGEQVVPQGQAAGNYPQPVVQLIDQSGQGLQVSESSVRMDGRKLLVGLTVRDKRNNGPMTRAQRRA